MNFYRIVAASGTFYLYAADAIEAMANANRILGTDDFAIRRVDLPTAPFGVGTL